MIQYNLIQNEKLRNLVLISESIQSLGEVEIQRIVEGMAMLSSDEQDSMILLLEEEQQKIASIKLAKGITPEIEKQRLEKGILQLKTLNFKLTGAIRKENEKVEIQESNQSAENILKKL